MGEYTVIQWMIAGSPKKIYIYLYILCLSVNVKTVEPIGPKFVVWSCVTPGKDDGWSNLQKFASNKIRFLKIQEREHVHNWNRRWARSALKAFFIYIKLRRLISHYILVTLFLCEHSRSRTRYYPREKWIHYWRQMGFSKMFYLLKWWYYL